MIRILLIYSFTSFDRMPKPLIGFRQFPTINPPPQPHRHNDHQPEQVTQVEFGKGHAVIVTSEEVGPLLNVTPWVEPTSRAPPIHSQANQAGQS